MSVNPELYAATVEFSKPVGMQILVTMLTMCRLMVLSFSLFILFILFLLSATVKSSKKFLGLISNAL